MPGGRAVVVRFESKGTPDNMGNFRQRVAGAAYRKKAVRFRAMVRVDGAAEVEARLFVRVERVGGQQGLFDDGDPITGAAWKAHGIVGTVDEDAETLIVGLRVFGPGGAAMADASVEVIGSEEPWPVSERSRALSPVQLGNLTAFARLFGYVRHFHPSDQAATADWNAVAIEGIPVAEGASNTEDLARPEPVAALKPGVWYVDLTRLKNDGEWRTALPKLQTASAVILDMLGYPGNVGPDFLRNLFDKPFTSAQWHIPIVTQPDRQGWTFTDSHWNMTPSPPTSARGRSFSPMAAPSAMPSRSWGSSSTTALVTSSEGRPRAPTATSSPPSCPESTRCRGRACRC